MIILSPGPANISERVRRALSGPDIGHRESEFSDLLGEVRTLLLRACGVSQGYSCAFFCGSGTTGIEAAITSLSTVSSGVLILSNGMYGERAAQIADTFQIPFTLETSAWTQPIPLSWAEASIRKTHHNTVYLVHHETTTGVLNPLQAIAEAAKRYQKRVLVDAVSSIAGEVLDLAGWGIDGVVGSANKCIRGVPGVSFVIVAQDFLNIILARRRVSFSTDLVSALLKEEAGETPFTPPVQAFYGLREALRELADEGLDNRIAHYRHIAKVLRDGLSALGLKLLVPREYLSNTMTSVMLPKGLSYSSLHGQLKQHGYLIYKSQAHLGEITFRLGTVGNLTERNICGFLDSLKRVIENR